MLDALGWVAGFFGAAVIALVLSVGARWTVYLFRMLRGRRDR